MIDTEKIKNPELKIDDIKPKWTIIYDQEVLTYPEDSIRKFEFFWDTEKAVARCRELLGTTRVVPIHREFQERDYSFLYNTVRTNDISRLIQIRCVLVHMMKEKFPKCGDHYTTFMTMWTDGDFMVECRHGADFSPDHSNGTIHSFVFDNNEIFYETRKMVDCITDESSLVKTKIM